MKHMLRNRLFLLLLPICLFAGIRASASHFYGADFFYTWVSGNTYTITLTVYGDCSGGAFSSLSGATPEVQIRNGTTLVNTIYLTQVGLGVEVTPVCPLQAGNTVCNSALSTIPGVKRYIYSGNYTLNALSANWKFTFTGNHNTASAGRSNTISNINSGSTTVLEARLNNLTAPNSSVNYTTIPTPFFCVNKPANYNPGAVDPNLDSLSFALVTGLSSPGTVTYITPYTATAPLATGTGAFSTSGTNGQITFTPNAAQRSLVVSQVNEYRNNVLVGTSMREMTFVVLNTCSNNPPVGTVSNHSTGVANINGTTTAACAYQGIISFKINPTDADGDHINMQVAGLPAGATFSITGNNGYTPSGTFTWNIAGVTPGTYTFFVTFTDDGCPLSSKQTVAYTVIVYGLPNSGYTLISPATCAKKAVFSFTPFAGAPTYTVSITGGSVADTFRNVNGTVIDSAAAGTYTISTLSTIGCSYDTVITILPPTTLTVSATAVSPTCVGGADGSITATGANGLTPYTYAIGAGPFSAAATFSGLSAGTYIIHVRDAGGCTKDSALTVIPPADIYSTVGLTQPPCNHFPNGSITIAAYNSVAPYTYAIGAGVYGSSGTFSSLFSGLYTVHIKNSLGCIKDTIVQLPDSVKIAATIPVTNTLCFGNANGSITVNASGAYPPYVYAIDAGAYGTSNTFSGLAAGTYIIHVRDTALCYFDSTITITEPALLAVTPTVTANVTCYGGNDGIISLAASGGTPPYAYSNNAGPYGGSNIFGTLTAGSYSLSVKDANGCTKFTGAVIVMQPPPIVLGYTTVAPNCAYSADGSITISGSGGTPGYTYSVDGAAYTGTGTFTGLLAGPHVLHVKDAANCIKDSSIILLAPPRIIPGVAMRSSTCATLGDGAVTLSAAGGTPGYTYARGTGTYGASAVFAPLAAGTYVFHVKDAHGCIGDTTVTVVDSLVISGNIILTNVICYSQNNGAITVTGTGGQSPYTYALGAGSYGAGGSFSPLANGLYVLHIKDGNGCIRDTALTITQPTLLVPVVAVTNAACNASLTGTVTISASGGSPGYTYAAGTGAYGATGTFNSLAAGTYTFHVKDTHNCISDTTITITQPTAVAVAIVKTDVRCNGGATGTVTVTASGGTPGYTYAADAGTYGASNLITGFNAGSHTIHTKDAAGCIKDTSINITQPALLALGYTAIRPLCNGDANGSITISASGGTSPYLYSLGSSSFSATTIYNGLSAGTYVLHIRDANNCTKDSTIILAEPSPLAFSLVITNVLCNGGATGTVTVTASGGIIEYAYAIDAGTFDVSNVLGGLSAGVHTIHLKDANGCIKDSTISITQPARLRLGYTFTQPLCNGAANGAITISGIGGATPYQYALGAGAFGASGTFTGLIAGIYILHVKDTNGCTKDSTITLGQPALLGFTLAVTNVRCSGGNSGTITVAASGGVAAYSYAVDAGAFSAANLFTGLGAGTHIVHLKDVNGCTKDSTITITGPAVLGLQYSGINPSCNGASDGSVSFSGTGGTGPYLYSLNSGAFSAINSFASLSAGTYVLHIKDANGCTKDSTVTLTQPAVLGFTFTVTPVLCNGDTSGTVTVNASGGTAPYQYAADARPLGTNNALTGFAAGIHAIHLKDAHGCTKDSNATITEPARLLLGYTFTRPLCNGDTNGSITITASGGTAPYLYALNGGAFGASGVFNNLPARIDTLRIRDANGCTRDSIITFTQPGRLGFALAVTNVLCNGGSTGTVTVTASGGTIPYQFAADAGAFGSSNTFTGLAAGTHIIHLKDANGCTKDSSINITEPAVLGLTYTATQPLCNRGTTGTVTITGAGGTTPYTYAVNTGAFTATPLQNGLAAGIHVLHVKDANGCLKDSSITIGEPTAITVAAAVKRARCTPLVNGYVWLYPTGGTPGYTYAVGAGPYGSSSQFNNLASGIYTFHVKDANGCIKDTTIGVLDSVFVHTTYTVTNVTCNGGSNGSVTVAPFGGDLPYTYAVNATPYSATNPILSLPAGGHILHVKDDNGCVLDTALTITQPSRIIPNIVINEPLCYGTSTGSIQLGASGGTAPYTFANGSGAYISPGIFNSLPAGSYTMHVKDANGCIRDTAVTMGQPTKLVYDSLVITHVKCFGDNSGTVTVYAHDGTPPYTYAHDAAPYQAGNLITGFNAGTHVVHVKDANGCVKDTSVVIKQPLQLHYRIPGITQPTCEGYKDGSITIAASGGAPPYLYAIDLQPYKTVSIYTGLGEGSYTFHIQDSNLCIYDTTIVLTGYPHIVLGVPEITQPSCFGFTNGIINLNASGGVPPLTYHIAVPDMTNNTGIFDMMRKGTYTFNVTDAKGCRKDTTLTLAQPPLLTIASTATTNDCEGRDNDGTITTIVDGGTEPYSYSWNSGEHTDALNGLGNGSYWVTVTDANSCQDSSLAVVGYNDCCKPFIPDAFTPNGDGRNDIYRLRWKGDVSKLQFSVYNRFGERVFVSYQADVGWDGTYHGKLCDMGVYFYVVKFICGSKGDNHVEYKGDVTLVR